MIRVDGQGSGNSLIQVRGLSKTYRRGGEEIQVLQRLNLDVDKGDFVGFMGPSGSGKLRCSICSAGWTCRHMAALRSRATRSRICPGAS